MFIRKIFLLIFFLSKFSFSQEITEISDYANSITSKEENNPTGISTEASHIKLDSDEIGVINMTVKRAADKTANGYFAIFIILLVKL